MASDISEDKAFDIKKLESQATNPIIIEEIVGMTNVLTISCWYFRYFLIASQLRIHIISAKSTHEITTPYNHMLNTSSMKYKMPTCKTRAIAAFLTGIFNLSIPCNTPFDNVDIE